ncbi:MAG: hypothetical protein C0403_17055 [Desulfobacterium sp.]|nr:hypothetical protein [Desulfobacterium sp.]
MDVLICIDDTDQKDGPGTGHLAQALSEEIEQRSWGTCSAISRHQLFVHPDIPYTSHNSSLCFEAGIQAGRLMELIDFSGKFLHEKSAPGSDPGLCVAVAGQIVNKDKLTGFGRKAKQTVLTKNDAYELAEELKIHLSEHGGTGQGVIGALAGIGLRLSGNDGRFRGWYHFGREGDSISVKALRSNRFIDAVKSETGETLTDDTVVFLGGDEQKTVLLDAIQVLLVKKIPQGIRSSGWATLTKQEVKRY